MLRDDGTLTTGGIEAVVDVQEELSALCDRLGRRNVSARTLGDGREVRYTDLTVLQLRRLCRANELTAVGTRADLLDRLAGFIARFAGDGKDVPAETFDLKAVEYSRPKPTWQSFHRPKWTVRAWIVGSLGTMLYKSGSGVTASQARNVAHRNLVASIP